MSAKTFAVAVRGDKQQDLIPFNLEGTDQELYLRKPKDGQVALLMSVMGGYADGGEQVATLINVFMNILSEDTQAVVRRRILDPDDEFDIDHIMAILEWVIAEDAGRPTQSSPASTPSRSTSGKTSTGRARRVASTRSSSPSTDSATSSTPGLSDG